MLPVESSDISFDFSFDIGGVRFNLRSCGVAVIDGRVLVHRLRHEDYWSFPGGRCRIEETSTETRFHELGFYFAFRRVQSLAGDPVPIERKLEYAWFPVDRLPTVKPSFLVEALSNNLPRAARYMLADGH
ncbi:MAG: hypothetical protein OXF41_11510 [bacterium]|nr:hypothetical protein [bacterium]